jgi:hypothetical protein
MQHKLIIYNGFTCLGQPTTKLPGTPPSSINHWYLQKVNIVAVLLNPENSKRLDTITFLSF